MAQRHALVDLTRRVEWPHQRRLEARRWLRVDLRHSAKKKTVFGASDLLVVEEGVAPSAFNVEVASSDEEVDGGDGASVGGGQFDE